MKACTLCGSKNDRGEDFCGRCRSYIGPPRVFPVDTRSLKHPDDAEAIESLSTIPFFPSLVKRMIGQKYRSMREATLGNAVPVFRKNYPDIYQKASDGARMLGLSFLPEIYVAPSENLNAYTFGTAERPVIVVTRGLISLMTPSEIGAVLGHEMGHVKCEHVVYHTLAQCLLSGVQLVAAGSIIFDVLTSALFKGWLRASEISADRASLLIAQDINVVRSAHLKLTGWRGRERQDKYMEAQKAREGRLESVLLELMESHPQATRRITEMEAFWRSEQYLSVLQNVVKNERIYRVVKSHAG